MRRLLPGSHTSAASEATLQTDRGSSAAAGSELSHVVDARVRALDGSDARGPEYEAVRSTKPRPVCLFDEIDVPSQKKETTINTSAPCVFWALENRSAETADRRPTSMVRSRRPRRCLGRVSPPLFAHAYPTPLHACPPFPFGCLTLAARHGGL